MIDHLDKEISAINYNYLNLPKQITQSSKVTNYTYRADGVKVKKLFGDLETDYLDGFQYKSTFSWESWNGEGTYHPDPNEIPVIKLRIIPTSEGYYDAFTGQYVYNFTDHLGNVRLSYSDTNKDGIIQPRRYKVSQCFGGGTIDGLKPIGELPICIDSWKPGEIVEVNNYYPFGMLHNYTATTQNAYQYKYQGQELQETGWYSFKWRNYDPTIGRFFNVDPLSEKYTYQSHYNFSENWLINARELEGLEAVLVNENTIEWRVKVNNQLGADYSKILLQDTADVLSQNGLTVKIIEDPKALFTINLARPVSKFTDDGIVTINGSNKPDGNIYDGEVTSKDSPRTLRTNWDIKQVYHIYLMQQVKSKIMKKIKVT